MQKSDYPCVLSIAGTDPSGGAGIQADIKSISANGCYAASVITALVAQNTQAVQSIMKISPDFVTAQLESVFSDLSIAAVKIGMLHNADIIEVVAAAIRKYKPENIVLDPVMVAKNGSPLLLPTVIHVMKEKIMPLVHLVTPNIAEAKKLTGREVKSLTDMSEAARKLADDLGVNVLLKGGHLSTHQASDILISRNDKVDPVWFHATRIDTRHTHGTGCTLSSAIAARLAQGFAIDQAVHRAKEYVTKAIEGGIQLGIGHGCGPLHHFYFLERNFK